MSNHSAASKSAICPMCGQTNACQIAKQANSFDEAANEPCWCMSADWAQLSSRMPADIGQRQQCVCMACASALLRPHA